MISEIRLIGFLFNGCLVTSQPQSVLKMFLNFGYISNTGTTQKCPNVFTVEKSITVLIIYMKKLLDFDWLRAVQFKRNTSAKSATPVQKV